MLRRATAVDGAIRRRLCAVVEPIDERDAGDLLGPLGPRPPLPRRAGLRVAAERRLRAHAASFFAELDAAARGEAESARCPAPCSRAPARGASRGDASTNRVDAPPRPTVEQRRARRRRLRRASGKYPHAATAQTFAADARDAAALRRARSRTISSPRAPTCSSTARSAATARSASADPLLEACGAARRPPALRRRPSRAERRAVSTTSSAAPTTARSPRQRAAAARGASRSAAQRASSSCTLAAVEITPRRASSTARRPADRPAAFAIARRRRRPAQARPSPALVRGEDSNSQRSATLLNMTRARGRRAAARRLVGGTSPSAADGGGRRLCDRDVVRTRALTARRQRGAGDRSSRVNYEGFGSRAGRAGSGGRRIDGIVPNATWRLARQIESHVRPTTDPIPRATAARRWRTT